MASRLALSSTWLSLPSTPAIAPYYRCHLEILIMYKDNSRNCQEMNLSITITSKIISSNKLKLNDQELNLSFVANLTDAAIHKLLSAPRDSRPGALWSFVYLLLRSFCICCWDLLWICCWDLLWICSYLFVCVFWVRLWSSIRVDYLD